MTGSTSTRLADGRELIYFDDAGSRRALDGTRETAPDQRELPERAAPGELRFDALTDECVAVAAYRQTRTHLPPADQCPLCPTIADNPSDRAIVEATLELAKAFGMSATAEGVEVARQSEVLEQLGCTRVQGFLFSTPEPAERLTARLVGS